MKNTTYNQPKGKCIFNEKELKTTYYNQQGDLIISVQMDEETGHVIIETPQEVYAGPVELISWKSEIVK